MSSEVAKVRTAVAESQKLGTLSTALCRLVEIICRRRTSPQMADDISQHVLCNLLDKLDTIRVETSYEYITMAIVKSWRKIMRGRRTARRYLIWLIHESLEWVPSHDRPRAIREAMGSFLRLRYLA